MPRKKKEKPQPSIEVPADLPEEPIEPPKAVTVESIKETFANGGNIFEIHNKLEAQQKAATQARFDELRKRQEMDFQRRRRAAQELRKMGVK